MQGTDENVFLFKFKFLLLFFILKRTIYECGICCSKHHINELISMLFCEHRACKACLEKYLTIQIREKQRVLIKCPFCKCVLLIINHYFNQNLIFGKKVINQKYNQTMKMLYTII